MSKDHDIIYDVQTRWKDIHVPTFILTTSLFYFTEQVLTHPFDVIRTKLQVAQQKMTVETIRRMIKTAGISGLYTAFLPTSIGFMPGNVVYLLTYAYAKDRLQKIHDSHHPHSKGYQPPWVSFTSGVLADIAAVSLYCPVEVVVQRMFIQDPLNKRYKNSFDAVRKIYLEEGVTGFYKGWGTIMVNSIPASAIWWTIYEAVKTFVSTQAHFLSRARHVTPNSKTGIESTTNNNNNNDIVHKHFLGQLLGGAIAGGCVTTLTNPLDMIRTRLQTQHVSSHITDIDSSPPPAKYKNLRHALATIYREEGAAAFFKGLAPRMSSYVLFSTIGALAYEMAVDLSTRKR